MFRTEDTRGASYRVKRLLSVCALTVTTGCSFAMDVAPSDPSRRTVEAARECTASVAAPIVDSISAAVGAYNTGVSVGATDEVAIYGIHMKRGAGLALGVTQLAAFGIAATYGFVQASRCHTLRAERHLDAPPEQPPAAGHGSLASNPMSTTNSASPAEPTQGANASPDAIDAGPAELPSWSAFRRQRLDPPQPHTPASRFSSP